MLLNILLPPIMVVIGIFFLFKTKFFFILHPFRTLKFTFEGENKKESISSLTLALAGTLGVGNIVGVASGLALGGAGSVFWLIISSLFSSAVKYSEVCLSAGTGSGLGMIGVIEAAGSGISKAAAGLYAALCITLSLSMGNLMQGAAIREASISLLPTPAFALPLIILCSAVCLFGKGGIKKAVALSVPLAAVCYTGMCLFVIIPNLGALPRTFMLILRSAFNLKSISGGLFAFLVKSGMREGFRVGLLSNEAGAGTSSFSHTSHECQEPTRAGCFGVLEVLADTMLLCPITALTLLLGGTEPALGIAGLSALFLEYIGGVSSILLAFSISAFALSSVFCWYYYGELCRRYLFGKRLKLAYLILFNTVFAVSLIFKTNGGIIAADTSLFFLFLITVFMLIKNSEKVTPPF